VRRAEPVSGLAAAAVHQDQRVGMARVGRQLIADVHLVPDGHGAVLGGRRGLDADEEMPLSAQTDDAGLTLGAGLCHAQAQGAESAGAERGAGNGHVILLAPFFLLLVGDAIVPCSRGGASPAKMMQPPPRDSFSGAVY